VSVRLARALLSAGLLSLVSLLGASQAVAAGTPFHKTGTLAVTGGAQPANPVHVKFTGTIPVLKKREYVAYNTVYVQVPSNGCSYVGYDETGSRKPRHMQAFVLPLDIDMTDSVYRWCTGKWLAQAQVYTPAARGGFKPRLTFARKYFALN
jgi:hypothetical protein